MEKINLDTAVIFLLLSLLYTVYQTHINVQKEARVHSAKSTFIYIIYI